MMDTVASNDVPRGHLGWKDGQNWVILTAYRTGSEEAVTVEMPLDQWYDLPPVQYVVKVELSRQQPRRPGVTTGDPTAALPVPRGHIEWRDGQNWVILTAYCTETQEAATIEVALTRWFGLIPVRAVVEEQLERWQNNKLRSLGLL
jgi:hypothetical protein